MPAEPWASDVLSFWFGELGRKDWFGKDLALDESIRRRFQSTYECIAREVPIEALLSSADEALAAVVVLDQFPRNMFRGTARMYESDRKALALADQAIAQGLDAAVPVERRLFIYLPLEHSEALVDQHRSVELFKRIGDADYSRYAEAHRDVISRFGRFPHRNALLGRTSTPDEIEFLKQPNSGF